MMYILIKLPQFVDSVVSGKLQIDNINPFRSFYDNTIDFQVNIDGINTLRPSFNADIDYNIPVDFDLDAFKNRYVQYEQGLYQIIAGPILFSTGVEQGILINFSQDQYANLVDQMSVSLLELNVKFKNPSDFNESLYTEDFEYLKLGDASDFGGMAAVGSSSSDMLRASGNLSNIL